MEEMEGAMVDEFGGPQMQGPTMPGEPSFVFVSKVSAKERDAATAEAFAKAKEQAGRLAAAAGGQLGPIRQVVAQASAANDGGQNEYMNYQVQMMMQMGMSVPAQNDDEATGVEPGPVAMQVQVTASFALR